MALIDNTIISLELHMILNQIGYSERCIKERVYSYDKNSVARTLSARIIQNRNDIDRIFVGSLREGIGFSHISDTDVLQLYKSVQCVETTDFTIDTSKLTFLLENDDTPPGYFHLKLVEEGQGTNGFKQLKYALVEYNGELYLSSDKYMSKNDDMFATSDGYIGQRTCYNGRKGPSLEKETKKDWLLKYFLKQAGLPEQTTMDYVRGFPCLFHSILLNWKAKPRTNDWPSNSVLDDVVKPPAVLVPVGQHGSLDEHLQWRICFPYGELRLINSLDNSQKQVLVLLKLIAKHILHPICVGMTTYVMKNVMFWMAETTPGDKFKCDTIFDRLLDALVFLRDCIGKDSLPYYMIEERNLLHGKLNRDSKVVLVDTLNHLIDQGTMLIRENIFFDGKFTERVIRVLKMHSTAHFLERTKIIMCEKITLEQLTEYYVKQFQSQSFIQYQKTDKAMALPALWKCGKSIFSDPLGMDLLLKDAAADLEITSRKTLLGTIQSKTESDEEGMVTNRDSDSLVNTDGSTCTSNYHDRDTLQNVDSANATTDEMNALEQLKEEHKKSLSKYDELPMHKKQSRKEDRQMPRIITIKVKLPVVQNTNKVKKVTKSRSFKKKKWRYSRNKRDNNKWVKKEGKENSYLELTGVRTDVVEVSSLKPLTETFAYVLLSVFVLYLLWQIQSLFDILSNPKADMLQIIYLISSTWLFTIAFVSLLNAKEFDQSD